jgi:hypothetical protein
MKKFTIPRSGTLAAYVWQEHRNLNYNDKEARQLLIKGCGISASVVNKAIKSHKLYREFIDKELNS